MTQGLRGAVSVETDGFGMVPTFWARTSTELLVSTHLASLVSLGLSPEPDTLGSLQYLAFLHPLDDRTILAGARLLPPGALLRHSMESGTHVQARPVFTPAEAIGDDRAAVEEFGRVWSSVMADLSSRSGGQRVAVGLSGGLDSRAIAGGALRAGLEMSAYSYGSSTNREVRVARAVGERLGLAHVTIPVTDASLLKDAASDVHRFDGAHSPAMLYDCWFESTLRSLGDVLLNGHGGGPVWGDEKAFGLRSLDLVTASVWRRSSEAVTAVTPLLSGGEDLWREVHQSLRTSLSQYDFEEREDAVVFWNLHNRQRRWGNMVVSALRRQGMVVETPFLDSRVLRYSASLAPDQHRNGRLYPLVHNAIFPVTADVPRSDDGNSPKHLNHLYWTGDVSLGRQLGRLALTHPLSALRLGARRALHESAVAVRDHAGWSAPVDALDRRAAVFPLHVWASSRRAYQLRLADFIDAEPGHHPLISHDVLTEAARRLRSQQSTLAPLALSKAATLDLWTADHVARARGLADLQRISQGQPGRTESPEPSP